LADQAAWQHHLEQLGIAALQVTPDPTRVATEGALWGAIAAHGFLNDLLLVIAIAFGTINVLGGFFVTDRMLGMFKAKAKPVDRDPSAEVAGADSPAARNGTGS